MYLYIVWCELRCSIIVLVLNYCVILYCKTNYKIISFQRNVIGGGISVSFKILQIRNTNVFYYIVLIRSLPKLKCRCILACIKRQTSVFNPRLTRLINMAAQLFTTSIST